MILSTYDRVKNIFVDKYMSNPNNKILSEFKSYIRDLIDGYNFDVTKLILKKVGNKKPTDENIALINEDYNDLLNDIEDYPDEVLFSLIGPMGITDIVNNAIELLSNDYDIDDVRLYRQIFNINVLYNYFTKAFYNLYDDIGTYNKYLLNQ